MKEHNWYKKSFYCAADNHCGKCRVCKYLAFREWAENVAPQGSTIERDEVVDKFIKYFIN
jgi:hypothetical protein